MKVLVQDPSSTVLWLGLEASTTSSPSGLVWICSSPDTSSSHTWTSTRSAAPAAGSSSCLWLTTIVKMPPGCRRMADVTPDAMCPGIPLLLGLGAVGREDQEPNLVRLQLGKGTVLINFGLPWGQRSFMSTQTTGLGCHETSLPQPGSSRVLHGMSSAGQTPPKVQLTCLQRGVSVCFGGRQVRSW